MKKIILVISLLFSSFTYADSIRCYNDGRLIYHYEGVKDVRYLGDLFAFQEERSGKVVLYSGDCIVKIDI